MIDKFEDFKHRWLPIDRRPERCVEPVTEQQASLGTSVNWLMSRYSWNQSFQSEGE